MSVAPRILDLSVELLLECAVIPEPADRVEERIEPAWE